MPILANNPEVEMNRRFETQQTLEDESLVVASETIRSYYEVLSEKLIESNCTSNFRVDEKRHQFLNSLLDKAGQASSESMNRFPSSSAIESARKAIESLRFVHLLPETIAPSMEGGVAVYFSSGDKKAYIEFANDDEPILATYDRHSEPRLEILETGITQHVVDTLKTHLLDERHTL